jgi:hypothetical protein
MLADAKDKRIVQGQTGALWLSHIEVVSLSVWRWMESQERVWRICARMRNGKTKSQVVRIELVRMLSTVSRLIHKQAVRKFLP